MMIIGTEGALGLPTAYDNQGWTGKLFFSRGGAGRGGARPKFFRAGNPPFPTVRGGAGKGSKLRGGEGMGWGTYRLYQLIEIICYSKGNLNSHCIK